MLSAATFFRNVSDCPKQKPAKASVVQSLAAVILLSLAGFSGSLIRELLQTNQNQRMLIYTFQANRSRQ